MSDGRVYFEGNRNNNFGFLRLLFAALVVVSHSPELVDGNRSREILTQTFGTMSFGEVAVDGFFLISGYLITKSFIESRSTSSYLIKRFLRIVPGYLVSFWICVLLIAPFVVADSSVLSAETIRNQLLRTLRLAAPDVPGTFQGLPYPALNGPMWTIAYEFRCYLAAAVFGLLGVYKPRYRVSVLVAVTFLLFLNAAGAMRNVHMVGTALIGSAELDARFAAVFGVGALYFLYRDKVRLTGSGALVAATLLAILLFSRHFAEFAYAILGGYLIFWFAFKFHILRASRFNNKADISYGLYLYAWPIQNLIIWTSRDINPWILCFMTLLGASLLAYLSWTFVERPALQLTRKRHRTFPLGQVAGESE
jgi:peptidoglycan/LPS O-acetylase OafA/YrhL